MRVFELDNDRNSILCSTHSFYIRGKDCGQEEEGVTDDKIVGWHH